MQRQLSKALARLNSATINAVLKGTYKGEAKRLPDGGGLYLVPGPQGGGSWVLRYKRDGKPSEAGLGSLATVGAAEARAMRAKMVASKNPQRAQREARKAEHSRAATFKQAAEPIIAHYQSGPFHAQSKARFRKMPPLHIFPKIGHLTVDEIGKAEVLSVVRPLWSGKRCTAERTRAFIEAVIDEAKAMGQSDEDRANPARLKALAPLLRRHALTKARRKQTALDWRDMPRLMAKLSAPRSPTMAQFGLMLTILSGVRASEALGARWDEFKGDCWHIPAERMKGPPGEREPHDVPVSEGMALVLNRLRPMRGASPFVFAGYKGKPLTAGSMWKALCLDLDYNGRASVHGMRASLSTFAQDNGYPDAVAEAALAHKIPGVRGRYARSPLFDQRVPLMKAWSDHCLSAVPAGRHLRIAA
jgi:integrase